jgi:hypothetical protein
MLTVYVLKNGVGRYNTFFLIFTRNPISKQYLKFLKGIQSLKFIFFTLKVANIRCFILIAVEIFHYIICKSPRTNEIRRFLLFGVLLLVTGWAFTLTSVLLVLFH